MKKPLDSGWLGDWNNADLKIRSNMYICHKCKKEMRCEKNGVTALFKRDHGYSGDLFKCPSCQYIMLATSREAYIVSEFTKASLKNYGCLLEMPE